MDLLYFTYILTGVGDAEDLFTNFSVPQQPREERGPTRESPPL